MKIKPSAYNIFPAKLCFDGKLLICNGRIWKDATDNLMRATAKREKEKTCEPSPIILRYPAK